MATWTRPDGETIYYRTHRAERDDAPLVVFLNGMTQTTQNWSSQARAFSERFHVLTYDARGQGKSPVGALELSLELHAADLVGLLDALGHERVHLVGFSHGARVALATAALYPELVHRLVLCSATARPTALAATIMRAWREVLTRGGLEAMSWAALPTILGETFLAENQKILNGVIRAGVQRNTEDGIGRMLDALLAYPDLASLASQVTAPTLVVSADHDLLVTPAGAQELASLCGGTHELVRGVGHTIPIEAPEAFREAVLPFLESA